MAIGARTLRLHRPSQGLTLRAMSLLYLGVMVVLPMLAMTIQAARPGPSALWQAVSEPYAWHSLKLTFATTLVMVLVNVGTGTATAWVLVRYEFPGRSLVNALIDLPFAVPTVVTGVMLVAFYGPSSVVGAILARGGRKIIYDQPGIIPALLFVTYPFVIRSVQPVLLELDRAEEEAAATLGARRWTTFLRVTLPTLRPSVLTGAGLSFSRALGEFGSVMMVAGNQPLLTKTAPIYVLGEIESGNRHGALAVSTVLLGSSLSNAQRMTGVILKYRCPRRPGEVESEPPLGPQLDAQRAVRLVRSRARGWGVDPNRIGVSASRTEAISPWRPRPVTRRRCTPPGVPRPRFRRQRGLRRLDRREQRGHVPGAEARRRAGRTARLCDRRRRFRRPTERQASVELDAALRPLAALSGAALAGRGRLKPRRRRRPTPGRAGRLSPS